MKGKILVVYNDEIGDEDSFIEKNKMLVESAKKNNITLSFKSSAQLYTFIDNDSVKSKDSYGTYDYCLFFNKDSYLAKNLEIMGVNVVNPSKALDICENKANMYQQLVTTNINIPKTVILPSVNANNQKSILEFVQNSIDDLGLPLVVKEFYGTSGESVFLARTKDDLLKIINEHKTSRLLFQEYITEASGSDIRIFVIKNKVVASLRRQGGGSDFRSNVGLGGTMYNYIPTYNDEQLAINATKTLGCEFAVVDILRSINGPVVCEVNATANINNFYNVCKVNIADLLFKNIK